MDTPVDDPSPAEASDSEQPDGGSARPAPSVDMEEFHRLVARGISAQTALQVLQGKADEEEAVSKAAEAVAVDTWKAAHSDPPDQLEPRWELARERFHFSLDGASAGDKRIADVAVIEADMAEVVTKLTFASTRKDDPWTGTYRIKTVKTAYRWFNGLRVTPPLIGLHEGQLNIVGGLHRFHLAKHYGATRIPLLVDRAALPTVQGILKSATVLVP